MNIYKESEQFLTYNPKAGSLQNRIFDAAKHKKIQSNPKHIFALVSSTLKFKPFLEKIIKSSKLLQLEKKLKISNNLAVLLVHDLLLSKSGRIQCGKHPVKEAILRNKTRLQAELTKLKLKHGVQSLDALVEDDDTPIRWFRANLIKTTKDKLLKEFSHLEQVYSIDEIKEPGKIYHDEYIPNLFGIHPREKLTSTDAYLKGRVIIQDRASCFPAYILNPKPNVDKVIDACAAPGNKTTHLASILKNSEKSIIAFEKDEKRVKTLKMMCDKAGGLNCISIQHGDFTKTRPQDFPEITGFVVDPSCSGSGIFGRAFDEENGKGEIDEARLAKLASFQFTIVKHALSFPNARKLVYSTCSIHPQENERVVIDLLNDEAVKKQGWRLSKRKDVIENWPRRGFVEEFTSVEDPEAAAGACVRSLPKVDGGIGFFAASFERDPSFCSGELVNGDEQPEQEANKYEAQEEEEEEEEEEGEDDPEDDAEDEEEEWTGFDD